MNPQEYQNSLINKYLHTYLAIDIYPCKHSELEYIPA